VLKEIITDKVMII